MECDPDPEDFSPASPENCTNKSFEEEEGTHEVEVPKDVVSQLEGGRLHQLKQMAGGDIQIAFQTKPDHGNAVAVIRGPQAHASLGAILVMQELCDLVQIPV
eukprot:g16770.t1